ncbi:MAG: transglutaminase-like cysteine peptidase [Rhodospirillales bacterium]|nr:transglutaminase-like cysteine peptidase [Rhodospirillales bacterium]
MLKNTYFLNVPALALAFGLAFGPPPARALPLSIKFESLVMDRPAQPLKLNVSELRSKRYGRRRSSSKSFSRTQTATAGSRRKKLGANSSLFGTVETQSNNFKPFKKWSGAVEKMAREQSDVGKFKKRFNKWVIFLDGLKGKDRMVQIKAVNKFMNKSKYILDNKNWGVKDYWASPGEFLAKFGDCEDYAIAKYMALKYLGHDAAKMRVVAVKDMNLNIGHAILAVYVDNRILILDNQIKIAVDSRKIRHYQPVYSINEKYWWRHRAS